jgi:hypothetical protein
MDTRTWCTNGPAIPYQSGDKNSKERRTVQWEGIARPIKWLAWVLNRVRILTGASYFLFATVSWQAVWPMQPPQRQSQSIGSSWCRAPSFGVRGHIASLKSVCYNHSRLGTSSLTWRRIDPLPDVLVLVNRTIYTFPYSVLYKQCTMIWHLDYNIFTIYTYNAP